MKTTVEPQVIYDAFSRFEMLVTRIDRFDKGNYAELRLELKYPDYLSVEDLQDITNKLRLIQQQEEIDIKIVNIDMRHHSMRVNIHISA